MKHNIILAIILLALLLFIFIFPAHSQTRARKPITGTIDYILKNDDGSGEVWVKKRRGNNYPGYVFFVARLEMLPDSLKVGNAITLYPEKYPCNNCIVFKYEKTK